MQNKAFTVLLFMTWYVDIHVKSCLASPPFAFENFHTTYPDTRLKHEQSPLYLLQQPLTEWPPNGRKNDIPDEPLEQQHKLQAGAHAIST